MTSVREKTVLNVFYVNVRWWMLFCLHESEHIRSQMQYFTRVENILQSTLCWAIVPLAVQIPRAWRETHSSQFCSFSTSGDLIEHFSISDQLNRPENKLSAFTTVYSQPWHRWEARRDPRCSFPQQPHILLWRWAHQTQSESIKQHWWTDSCRLKHAAVLHLVKSILTVWPVMTTFQPREERVSCSQSCCWRLSERHGQNPAHRCYWGEGGWDSPNTNPLWILQVEQESHIQVIDTCSMYGHCCGLFFVIIWMRAASVIFTLWFALECNDLQNTANLLQHHITVSFYRLEENEESK